MTAQIAAYGRLGQDPRSHETKSGAAMTTTTLAVDIEAREQGADNTDATIWLQLVAFGRVADDLARHAKGEPVSVSGCLQLNRWKAADGATREGWQVLADSVVSARSARPGGGRRSGGNGGQRRPPDSRDNGPPGSPPGSAHDAPLDDPTPF